MIFKYSWMKKDPIGVIITDTFQKKDQQLRSSLIFVTKPKEQ